MLDERPRSIWLLDTSTLKNLWRLFSIAPESNHLARALGAEHGGELCC
ncbi:hypothetical protein [Devosia pacifica]|nr:hypothetical protein [Devosia pacifica]